ncbi:MAG: hypothetical protein R3302_05710 [Sulfurimonadaceae bacterium]|nr:hypothetical protein [Sulfurimonadaceae bacterium]
MGKVFILSRMAEQDKHALADFFAMRRDALLSQWIKKERVGSVLKSKRISPAFFAKHFGSRVIDYFIGVLRGTNKPGQCPVMIVMLKFFASRGLQLDEIYQICSGKRNTVTHALLESGIEHTDELFDATLELFDANFSGVIREYIEMVYGVQQHVEGELRTSCPLKEEEAPSELEDNSDAIDTALLENYFAADEDEGEENIVFLHEDADDLMECFDDITGRLSLIMNSSDLDEVAEVSENFSKAASILLHYTPYLDDLAAVMSELGSAMTEHAEAFMGALQQNYDLMLKLFDAVNKDMDNYIQRFSVESIAMHNSHHIHEPTRLSIQQIIAMFAPDEVDEGEIEFF